jgi:EpsI family protein
MPVSDASGADTGRREGPLLAGIFGLTALAFWPTLASFPSTWNASYREHGFFVGALVCYLIWRDGGRILRASRGGAWYLIPALVALSGVWLVAAITSVGVVQQLAFTAIGTGLALAVFGWAARRRILAIGLTFLLALPVWEFLVPLLQRVTTIASGALTKLAGIEAVVGEDYIRISSGTFLVEGGCAGVNYLLGGLVLGAFYAHLFVDRWQTQLKIVALTGAVSIVGNWIRVAVLVFLGEATAMESPYIYDHLWQGWAIFTALMIPAFLVATRIEAGDRRRHGSGAPNALDAADDDAPTTVVDPKLPRRASRAAIAAASGPILFLLVGAIPAGSGPAGGLESLGLVDPWRVVDSGSAVAWRPDYAGVDREVAYTLSDGVDSIALLRQGYLDQRQGDELIQSLNVIAPDSMTVDDRVAGPLGASGRLVREALIRTESEPRVVWYWYRVAGFDTPFAAKAKLLEVLAFFRRTGVAELFTLSVPCAPDDCREAGNVLRRAVGARLLPVDSVR